jgi:hypothetical protein
LLDRHRGANYKILPPDPIGLPPQFVFSTSSAADRAPPQIQGHNGPDAKAPLKRELSIDLPRTHS